MELAPEKAATLSSRWLQRPRASVVDMNCAHEDQAPRSVLHAGECLLREGLRRVLQAGGVTVAAQSLTVEELVRKLGAHRPDVVTTATPARCTGWRSRPTDA